MKAIGKFFNAVWRGLDGLRKTLHLISLLAIFGVIFAALTPTLPIVPGKAALVIDPQGELVEQYSGSALDRALAEASGRERAETLLHDVLDAIAAAADDDRIQALFLDVGGLAGGGLSKLEEIAVALRNFRRSGKPIVAFGDNYDQAQFYLAAQADEVYLDPDGLVYIDGFGYYRLFLKDAIDKLGIDVNVFRAGKFKSYTDQFSRSDMSEQEREESSAWLNALWRSYQDGVTTARKLDARAIGDYVEQLAPLLRKHQGNMAAAALERGLVSELKTRAQVEQRLMTLTGEDKRTHSFQSVTVDEYLRAEQPSRALPHFDGKKIGVVVASGEIVDGYQPPGTIGGDSTAALLREARFDDDIAAVVLRIDSPGGSVFASELIRREIDALKAAGKPVVASMSSTAASGGYYIAMNADEIWASATTLTGSIGVFAVLPTMERSLAKLGVHTDGVGTTPLAGGLSLERSLTPVQRELLQLSVDHEYREFVDKVAKARNKSFDEIDAIAQGRVWAGAHANERGLVDRLGLFQDALDAAAERANLRNDYDVTFIEGEETWRQGLVNRIHALAAHATRLLSPEQKQLRKWVERLTPLDAELRRLARFTDPSRAYYYCVCTVR